MNFKKMIFIVFIIFNFTSYSNINVSKSAIKEATNRIYINETGGIKNNLVYWNKGEEFASLGIGHFIWFPKNYNGPFKESFPSLIGYYKEKNIELPSLFKDYTYCPWSNYDEFIKEKDNPKVLEAINFLDSTREVQGEFMINRLISSMDEIKKKSNSPKVVQIHFENLLDTGGIYPLLDYINFKGEGTLETERYNGYGWGVLQVLEEMQLGSNIPLDEFKRSAKFVLKRRVENSPKNRNEKRWLKGWYNRIDTY